MDSDVKHTFVDIAESSLQKWRDHIIEFSCVRQLNNNYLSCLAVTPTLILLFVMSLIDGSCWEGDISKSQFVKTGNSRESKEDNMQEQIIEEWMACKTEMSNNNNSSSSSRLTDSLVRLRKENQDICVLRKTCDVARQLSIQQLLHWSVMIPTFQMMENLETETSDDETEELQNDANPPQD